MLDSKKLNICYIGGGSRNWAWVFMKDLCFEKELRGNIRLYDIDNEAAKANEALGNKVLAEHNPGAWTFKACPDIKEALTGADFVLISILPGSFEEMAVDVHEGEKYGIYQSVGDTAGVGGLSRSLRSVPLFEEIASAIKSYAPEAWVLNYTNPMTVLTRTLYKVFPKIKAFGCCHEVFGTQKLLCKMLRHYKLADEGIKRTDITTSVAGINHFTWISRASYKGGDLFPLYKKFVDEFYESGFEEGGDDGWLNSFFTSAERVKFDLFRRYGWMAAAGDRHLAEFCPPSWYLKDKETVKRWKFSLTPVSWRIEQRENLIAQSKAFREGREKFVPEDSGEEGIRILKALSGLGNLVTNVNLPNFGQAPHFPLDAVVESNAVFAYDSVQPVLQDEMPSYLRAMVLRHVENQEGIVDAALKRSLADAFLVFLNDGQVSTLTPEDAKTLFTTLTTRTLPKNAGYR